MGVDSTPGQGSTFWFSACLRLADEKDWAAPIPADLQGVRALVVDDNYTNREILISYLLGWGLRPDEASDGQAALGLMYKALAEDDPYRLAILDMQMPGMDGEALGRTIRADPKLQDARLVMMSSACLQGDYTRSQEIGFAAFLTKPVRHGELFNCLSPVQTGNAATGLITRHTARERARSNTLDFSDLNVRILLAEDNITNQQVALALLKNFGLNADVVSNGFEVLKAMETTYYDLVLMDIQMPEMDGLEATRQIRTPQTTILNRHAPIIALTAHATLEYRMLCEKAGMDDYLTKPFDLVQLAEALKKWLPKDETQSRAQETVVHSSELLANDHSSPIFNFSTLKKRLGGDEELAESILQVFLEDMPRQIAALRVYCEAGDASGAERQAHKIRGAAANVGADALSSLASEMEKVVKAGIIGSVKTQLDTLELLFGELKRVIERDRNVVSEESTKKDL